MSEIGIRFKPKWISDREVLMIFDSPEKSDIRYRSFVKVYGRCDENGYFPDQWPRLRVPHPADHRHSCVIEVPPNRTYMIDVGLVPGSEMPRILVIDIGDNQVSEYSIRYPEEVYNAMQKADRIKGMES